MTLSSSGPERRAHLTTAAKAAVLERSPVFERLPGRERELLAEMLITERFAAGEALCQAGEPAGSVHVVARGRLEVRLPGSGGVRAMVPGDVVGEYGMFGAGVRTAEVTATEDSVVLSLDYDRFLALLRTQPEVTLALFRITVERLVERQRHADAE